MGVHSALILRMSVIQIVPRTVSRTVLMLSGSSWSGTSSVIKTSPADRNVAILDIVQREGRSSRTDSCNTIGREIGSNQGHCAVMPYSSPSNFGISHDYHPQPTRVRKTSG